MGNGPIWLEIDLDAVRRNTRTVLEHTRKPLMAVVKANAYGLGAVQVGRAALFAGATWLAVARWSEARILRQAGISAPILIFGLVTEDEVDEAISAGVSFTLFSREMADLLAARAAVTGKTARVHLKVDTGFGRLGVLADDALLLAQYARGLGGIEIEGVYSHLAMADEEPGHPLTAAQIAAFTQAVNSLRAGGLDPAWVHMTNSAAAFGLPDAHFNLVRAGSALIGLRPFYFAPLPAGLERVVSWKARLASSKVLPDGWGVGYGQTYRPAPGEIIGVLPVGYADGFRRLPGNQVLIGGQRVPVIGRVCADVCMLSLPRPYPMGEEVVVLGTQGSEAITTDELIERWHTSQADVLANINSRVPRLYLGE